MERSLEKQKKWEQRTDLPLMLAAVAFFVAYALPVLKPEIPAFWVEVCDWAQIIIWAMFIIDYAVRFSLAPHRREFIVNNWFDLLIITLPMLRPLRLLRLLTVLRMFDRHAGNALRGKVTSYTIGTTLIVLVTAAIGILEIERKLPDSQIKDFSAALWWAITTVTTVGYGDTVPVSESGRFLAIALMIFGIALLGLVTGLLSSYLVEKVSETEDKTEYKILKQLEAQNQELKRLSEEVRYLREQLATAPTKE
ncbi:hypothetical protein BSR28_06730 [Boudabousia liubingyangii]|uniref:potassium channel family protein n=1 Tax=Boudabousia liubingyangii TaxID=1921764 RepID=UPI00093BC915|nr:potassium channel family protein [Boudabousia liubingyangii]OKL47094.1 hypothetical protein BSR28_06730 [Boudabousia liubingyangii]